ncbi:RbsD/FucU domain-containing protein [Kineococcus gynurae]|uniref:RbsD/FucU domain-containing protein n=1 Tax=Kineococcus gynurae TaxID=452979 RepID=A0ABV5LST9_9ACTN
MLKQNLVHPPLLAALARAGHGSRFLLADGNFPVSTVRPPAAETVHLNLAPGLLDIPTLLPILLTTVPVEEATLMRHPDGIDVPAHGAYRELLGASVPTTSLDRFAFYAAVRSPDVGLVVATGDLRLCSNLLLTVGLP